MAFYCSGNLYENEEAKELIIGDAVDIRVQAIGSGSFQLVGKLSKESDAKVLSCIRLSDFEMKSTIVDNEIYAADVAGLYSVCVQNVSGFTNIYMKGVA